jgi:NADH:ubiquinone oxidoreductase subunit C
MSANKREVLNKATAGSSQPNSSRSTSATTKPRLSPTQPADSKMMTSKSSMSPMKGTAAQTPSPPSSLAKTQPEAPAFEKSLVEEIVKNFGDLVKIVFIKPLRIKIYVDSSHIREVASFLRDKIGFDHAESVAGTDYPKDDQIEVIYHLGSYSRQDLAAHILWLTTRTDRDDARLPTLISVYKSVEYHERECYEMLGVYFEGHPRNERFLLPEDWADIPPLRKDFKIKGR